MMRRYVLRTSLMMLALSLIICADASAKTLTSKELIDDANTLDGQVVSYKGEAITAIMKRGDHSWINLNDGYNAIGIWCKNDLLKGVRWLGGYKTEGDVLAVTGVFHRACPEHGGDLDIHADRARIESVGFPFEEKVSSSRVTAATVFFIVTLAAIFVLRKRL